MSIERSIAFDTIADRYDETRGGLERGAHFAEAIAGALGPPDGVVLDIGVGTAAVALPLRQLGFDVVGVDLSLPMLRRAAERLGPSVVQGDAYTLPVHSGSAAAVAIAWLLQLVPDQAGVLAEARRVLRPGGRIAVAIARPTEHEPCDITAVEDDLVRRLGRERADRVDQARAAASDAGLVEVRAVDTAPQSFEQSPSTLAERYEQRLFGFLVGIDEADFERLVQPVIDQLLALPDPDRPRTRVHSHPVLLFEPLKSRTD